MKTTLKLTIATALFMFFVGCSMDVTTIIEHPSQAAPGSSYNTSFISSYLYLNTAPRFSTTVTRDSIHLAVGLPVGWQVLSMNYYAATNFSAIKAINGISEAALQQALVDSFTAFESRKAPMTRDASVTTRLAHRTFQVYDSAASEALKVAIDSIANWQSFSARFGVTFAANTPTDTFIRGDSVSQIAGTTAPDTIGITMVPVFFYATIQTGTTLGDHRVFIFEKSGSMVSNKILNVDTGGMAMAKITLTNVAVVNRGVFAQKGAGLTVTPQQNSFLITLNSAMQGDIQTRILASDGTCVATMIMHSNDNGKSYQSIWDGGAVQAGAYLVECRQAGKRYSKTFIKLK